MEAAPGQILRETKRAASYFVESPLDFEGKRRDCANIVLTTIITLK